MRRQTFPLLSLVLSALRHFRRKNLLTLLLVTLTFIGLSVYKVFARFSFTRFEGCTLVVVMAAVVVVVAVVHICTHGVSVLFFLSLLAILLQK